MHCRAHLLSLLAFVGRFCLFAGPRGAGSLKYTNSAKFMQVNPLIGMITQNLIDNTIENVKWTDLHQSNMDLRPALTLKMGQCFNWKELKASNIEGSDRYWIGTVNQFVIAIKQTPHTTCYAHLNPDHNSDETKTVARFLHSYFQLDFNMTSLYSQWANGCPRMEVVTAILPGVRILRQDPWECLVSFICSSNNNIKRISLMLERLRFHYGKYICTISYRSDSNSYKLLDKEPSENEFKRLIRDPTATGDDEENSIDKDLDDESAQTHHMYTFPSVEALAAASEENLKSLGMGYRAKFIVGSAKLVLSKGDNWLNGLRLSAPTAVVGTSLSSVNIEVIENKNKRLMVQNSLQELPGVGRKVADCVALFSLDQWGAVPVDVHVKDIAIRDYSAVLKDAKSLTPTIYENVGDIFRSKFGEKAGWAHSVLFAAELAEFRSLLPIEMQEEMKAYSMDRKEVKKKEATQSPKKQKLKK